MKDSNRLEYITGEKIEKNIRRLINSIVCMVINGICLATWTPLVLLQTIVFIYSAITSVVHLGIDRYLASIINDIKKNNLYADNKEELNEFVSKNKDVALNCVDSKVKDVILSASEDKPVFTINTIDKVKLKDLRIFLKNMKRYNQFNMESIPEKTYQEKEIDLLIEKYNSDEPKKYGLSNKERTRI